MALPFGAAARRYPDRPLVEEVAYQRPVKAPQKFVAPQALKVPRGIYPIPVQPPAAGSDFTTPRVPSGVVRRFHALNAQLVNSAVVAARRPNIRMANNQFSGLAALKHGTSQTTTSPASTTTAFIFSAAGVIVQGSDGFVVWVQFNPPLMVEGDRIESITALMDVGDQWNNIVFWVEDFNVSRGLARGEIPMGLESGFTWDLAEVRKVSED